MAGKWRNRGGATLARGLTAHEPLAGLQFTGWATRFSVAVTPLTTTNHVVPALPRGPEIL